MKNLTFLNKLINKVVIIHRSGPESKRGILRAVQSDYLVLETEDGLFFYQLTHVVSVHELAINQGEVDEYEDPLPTEKTFYSLIKSYINFHLKLNRAGSISYSGLVLDVNKDFVLLSTEEDGRLYINLNLINSASEIVSDEMVKEEEQLMESPSGVTFVDDLTVEIEEQPEEKVHNTCNNMNELCESLIYSTVVISNSLEEKLVGVLVGVDESSISIVKDNEVSRVVMNHIYTIKKVKNMEAKQDVEECKQVQVQCPETENIENNNKPTW
jgi:spore coat protein B